MGFQKPNIESVYSTIRTSLGEIHSPYNDGWTSSSCKKELYLLKCWLEIEYNQLPTFAGEEASEQNRILEILKK
jgi:hypothetical protein